MATQTLSAVSSALVYLLLTPYHVWVGFRYFASNYANFRGRDGTSKQFPLGHCAERLLVDGPDNRGSRRLDVANPLFD